jgi:hypothetical protein
MLIERFVSAACLGVLVTAIAALNDQVSQSIASVLQGGPSALVPVFGSRVLQSASTVTAIVGSYAGDNVPLVLFGLTALGLFGLMLRS